MVKVTVVRSARIPVRLYVSGHPGQVGQSVSREKPGMSETTSAGAAGRISLIRVEGHAGFAKSGKDIVCAAASVTAYTCAGAIQELAGVGPCHTEQEGFLEIKLPDDCWEDDDRQRVIDVITEATLVGFRQIEWNYPKYLKVIEKQEGL